MIWIISHCCSPPLSFRNSWNVAPAYVDSFSLLPTCKVRLWGSSKFNCKILFFLWFSFYGKAPFLEKVCMTLIDRDKNSKQFCWKNPAIQRVNRLFFLFQFLQANCIFPFAIGNRKPSYSYKSSVGFLWTLNILFLGIHLSPTVFWNIMFKT